VRRRVRAGTAPLLASA